MSQFPKSGSFKIPGDPYTYKVIQGGNIIQRFRNGGFKGNLEKGSSGYASVQQRYLTSIAKPVKKPAMVETSGIPNPPGFLQSPGVNTSFEIPFMNESTKRFIPTRKVVQAQSQKSEQARKEPFDLKKLLIPIGLGFLIKKFF